MADYRSRPRPTRKQIEQRAYELYLQRGGQDGWDFDDWIAAERELLGEEVAFDEDSSMLESMANETEITPGVTPGSAARVAAVRRRRRSVAG
jgi:hypothetical protein